MDTGARLPYIAVVGSEAKAWQTAEENLVLVGSNDTMQKIGSLFISLHNLVGIITIRRYMQINDTERRLYPDYIVDASSDPPGIPIVDGTMLIHEVLRITLQSDNAADNMKAVDYDYVIKLLSLPPGG